MTKNDELSARWITETTNKHNPNVNLSDMEDQGTNDTGFKLVKGEFTPAEAREVLTSLINSKLRFHSKKNLQAYEMHGKTDTNSEQRIQELKQLRKKVLADLSKATEEDCTVELQANVNLKFLKPVGS